MSASRQQLTVSSKSSSTKLEHDEYCLPLQLRASCQMFCHGVCEPNDCSCVQAAASACNARTQQARQPSRASLPACRGLQLKRKVEFRPSVSARISYPYRGYITTYIPKSHSRLGTGGVSASPAQNRGFGPPRPLTGGSMRTSRVYLGQQC